MTWAKLRQTLAVLPKVKAKLAGRQSKRLTELESAIELLPDIRAELEKGLVDECPLTVRDGGIIRPGFHAELDRLRDLRTGGKQWIAQYQADEMERTGIPNIKVGFNRVFGYYLEVSHAHSDKVPDHYIRKQTIKAAERVYHPGTKGTRRKGRGGRGGGERTGIRPVRRTPRPGRRGSRDGSWQPPRPSPNSTSWPAWPNSPANATTADPHIVDEPVLEIVAGRHPVLDILEPDGTFVPNDTRLGDMVASDRQEHSEHGPTAEAAVLLPASRSSPAPTWPARAPTSAKWR